MMAVVVSEEYFISKWPMIELHDFMQASVKNQNLKILPLFFGLRVDEFSDTRRQKRWFKAWEKMAKEDVQGRIKVDEWKQSLKLMDHFNGVVYNQDSKDVVAYRKEIVSKICKAIPPHIKFDESHVQGRSKLCKVVREHLQIIPNSTKILGVRVMGIHGVGGIGKTELCKIMCNELDGEFDGNVCHVELDNQSEDELVKKLLTTLTNTSAEVVQEVGKDKCRDVLLNDAIWKQKTFLTIDNVWDDLDSLEQANLYLRAPFVEGSWVIVTSRFKKTLISLDIHENACFELSELDKDDAKNIFLYYTRKGKEFENAKDVAAIEECIKSCYFGKGESQGSHYHPLSLKALGIFLQYEGNRPSVWMKDLQKLKESSYLRKPMNPLFTILRSNFDPLPQKEQELFMDVALFCPWEYKEWPKEDLMEWLCLVHNEEKEVLKDALEHLKDNALLEDVNMSNGGVSMHDLYREFAKLESKGKLTTVDMEKRRWVYAGDTLPTELEDEPIRSCWENLTRICIAQFKVEKPITSLGMIEWKYCTKLVVLKLVDLYRLVGVLNLKGLIRLRSLDVRNSTFDSIEGLEGLKTLTYISIYFSSDTVYNHKPPKVKLPNVGQLPASLKFLQVISDNDDTPVLFQRDILALCTNLVTLEVRNVFASDLDLRNCTSLQKVTLVDVKGLKVLQGFTSELESSLHSLGIHRCSELVEVCGLDCLVGLQSLYLDGNQKLSKLPSLTGMKRLRYLWCSHVDVDEVPGLDGLVGLESLKLIDCPRLSKLPSLTGLQFLRRLTISGLGISEIPNLSGLEQLKHIDASWNRQLTSLQGFGNLPAVTSINLLECESVCWLSDMSKMTNLKELDLCGTGVELHEEDIRMLEGLQLLEPVLVMEVRKFDMIKSFGSICNSMYRLDFYGHKILQSS